MTRVGLFATLFCTFALFPFFTFAYTSPGKAQGFVNDFAHIISSEQKIKLEQKLSDFNLQTKIQIAVVTISTLGDETIESYAVTLFKEWAIGQKAKDNGVLFLIAPTDRKVRIEVGYGLEEVLTDAQSNGIIQKIILPAFRGGKMEEGIVNGTDAIISVVKSETDYSSPTKSSTDNNGSFFYIILFIFWGFGFLIRILSRTKSWWLGGVIGAIGGIIIGFIFGFIFNGIIAIIILTILGLILDYIVSKHPPSGGGGGFWPIFLGGGRGDSGSGFGGFGGGGSGGGGSSGRW